eukprot:2731430-Pyramimonas_sp.AAC.1
MVAPGEVPGLEQARAAPVIRHQQPQEAQRALCRHGRRNRLVRRRRRLGLHTTNHTPTRISHHMRRRGAATANKLRVRSSTESVAPLSLQQQGLLRLEPQVRVRRTPRNPHPPLTLRLG